MVDSETNPQKCPYCNFQGASEEIKTHMNTHILSLSAKIDNVTVDYTTKAAFVHVVIGQGGNAKGADVAVPLPLEMKILGKVVLEGFSFSLLPD
jgi:hypothetical protein